MQVRLLIPIAEASPWDIEDLNLDFERAAEKAGGEVLDDSESEGMFEVFEFTDLTPEQVRDMAQEALRKHKEIKDYTISGGEVMVVVEPGPWIKPLNLTGHPYEKAMKLACTALAKESEWAAWLAKTGYTALWFHQSKPRKKDNEWPMEEIETKVLLVYARVDLSLLDLKPTKAEAEQMAQHNLKLIMDKVAEHLGIPHP